MHRPEVAIARAIAEATPDNSPNADGLTEGSRVLLEIIDKIIGRSPQIFGLIDNPEQQYTHTRDLIDNPEQQYTHTGDPLDLDAAASDAPLTAAQEAAEAALAAGKSRDSVRAAAQAALLSELPDLDTTRNVQAFIGASVRAMVLGLIDGKQASALLYSAQTALSAIRTAALEKRKQPASRPRRKAAAR